MSKVIIFPTDTVYGIATPIFDLEGIDRIYKIKKRDRSKPLACLCADLKQIDDIAYVSDKARSLINQYLPGALTLILKSKLNVKDKIGYDTIGVRIPDNEVALNILKENGPMLTTSVNDSGHAPLNKYEDIVIKYSELVDEIYMSDLISSNVSSTVVYCIDDKLEILRQGEIKLNNV